MIASSDTVIPAQVTQGVIPACLPPRRRGAGIQSPDSVIPAQAGIQCIPTSKPWIPASAGMTIPK